MKKAIQIILVQVMVIFLFTTPAFSKSPIKVVKKFVKAAKSADFKTLAKLSCKDFGPYLTVSDAQKLDLSEIGLIQKIVREEKSEIDPKRLHIVVARVSYLGKMGFGGFYVFKTDKGWKVHVSIDILKEYPVDNLSVSETVLGFYSSNKIYLEKAFKLAYDLGESYRKKRNYDKAINAFKKAIKIKPDDYETYRKMGIAYRNKKDFNNAMKSFNKALELKPDYYRTYLSIAIVYKAKGDFDNAIESYKKAIDLKPDDYNAYSSLGRLYYKKGNYEKAIMFAKKALKRKPGHSSSERLIAKAKKRKIIIKEVKKELMVLIPAGEFMMGSGKSLHKVYLDAYKLDKFEVTNLNYEKYDPRFKRDKDSDCDYCPAVNITWEDADAYCNWRDKRLPTEAEWEKAARGDLKRKKYPWGDKENYSMADFSYSGIKPVGTYPPNGYGLYDTTGNAKEWVADWFTEDYYKYSEYKNPNGPARGTRYAGYGPVHVVRGGCWSGLCYSMRVYDRQTGTGTNVWKSRTGFRCAQDTKEKLKIEAERKKRIEKIKTKQKESIIVSKQNDTTIIKLLAYPEVWSDPIEIPAYYNIEWKTEGKIKVRLPDGHIIDDEPGKYIKLGKYLKPGPISFISREKVPIKVILKKTPLK